MQSTANRHILFSLFNVSQFFDAEVKQAVRLLIHLRLFVAFVAILTLLTWNETIQEVDNWLVFIPLMVGVWGWSISVLAFPKLQTLNNAEAREITFDLAWTSILVALSGGASNPFIYYFLVIIALAAILLTPKKAWVVCVASFLIYSFLLLSDVQAHFQHFEMSYRMHLIGMWLNYLISALVICLFVNTLVCALRKQHLQFQDIREKNLKNEQLIGLATVSASTVHNLATPLSTLRLLIEDFDPMTANQDEWSADLELMKQQIFRCQDTMKQLSLLAQKNDQLELKNVNIIVHEIQEHYALNTPQKGPHFINKLESSPAIYLNNLFLYAVMNLINNALESSISDVDIRFSQNDTFFYIEIENLTNANNDQILKQWGNPTQSTKSLGLGIGSFLANSTIERLGGDVSMQTKTSPEKHDNIFVCVTIKIPLESDI